MNNKQFLHYTCFIALILLQITTFAQVTPEIIKGDKFAEEFQYDEAIYFYNYAHDIDDQNPVATRRLADIYNKIGDFEASSQWYQKTLEMDGAIDTDMLSYAESLKRLEKYDDAIFWYGKFAAANPTDRRAQAHIRNKKYHLDLWSDSLKYRMHQLEINGNMSAFGVVPFGEQYIFSTNSVNPAYSLEGKSYESPYLDIYICGFENEQFVDAMPLNKKVNSKYHDGPVYFDEKSETLFITRNNMKKGKPVKDKTGTVNLKIYTSAWSPEEGWLETEELDFNSDEYSTGHPCLAKNGKTLYFVSNMPGGYGGTDIYKSKWIDEKWSDPINLGSNINTEGDEMFPYVSKEGIIYFASNGHAGLGGMDNFMSEPWGETWSVAYNLGYPINTSKDDFGLLFVPGSEIGFFSSNREGTGGDKLYFFAQLEILEQLVSGRIILAQEEATLEGEYVVVDFVNRDSQLEIPLNEDGTFEFTAFPNDEVEMYMTGEKFDESKIITSYYADEHLEDTQIYLGEFVINYAIDDALAGVDGLDNIIGEFSSEEEIRSALMRLKGELTELENDFIAANEIVIIDDTELLVLTNEVRGLNIDNIYFAFDSYVINGDAKNILDDVVLHMNSNPEWKIEIDTHTDKRGTEEYNQILSEHRANAVRKQLIAKGIMAERILSRAHGEKDLIVACEAEDPCGEDVHQVNRRAEFRYMIEKISGSNPDETTENLVNPN